MPKKQDDMKQNKRHCLTQLVKQPKEAEKARKLELVRDLRFQGKSYRDIAKETGIGKSTVGELAKQLKTEPSQESTPAEPEPMQIDLEYLNESMFPD